MLFVALVDMTPKEELNRLMEAVTDILIDESQQELDDQGHNASGDLIQSFRANLKLEAGLLVGEILFNDYGLDIDRRRDRKEFPYPGLGKIWTDFINDLIEWASYVQPNLPRIEREQFAFAVARKMRKQGSPTRGAYRFSKNSRRTGWIDAAINASQSKVEDAIQKSRFVEMVLDENITQGVTGRP